MPFIMSCSSVAVPTTAAPMILYGVMTSKVSAPGSIVNGGTTRFRKSPIALSLSVNVEFGTAGTKKALTMVIRSGSHRAGLPTGAFVARSSS
jgi:hypothetical protein